MNEKPKPLILLVDDIPLNLDVLDGILNSEYRIKAATSGEMALKIAFSRELPDLILLDVKMPGIDGYETCRRLKANKATRNIPIIFVTAMNEEMDETKGFEAGAVDYIIKPVSAAIVKARVNTHISLHYHSKELEERVKERTAELTRTRLEIIKRLGQAAEYKDNETGHHVIRIGHYSNLIGLAAGMSKDEAELLLNTAPMHDIGKIGIPDSIMLKPAKLNDDEWKIMKCHPQIGYKIIGDDPSELLVAARVCSLSHHEKWNGMGYPFGLKGNDIPVFGRIIAIADVFDALVSERPYKKAWPVEEALNELKKEEGKHFDPKYLRAFFENLPEILKIKSQYEDMSSEK